MGVDNLVFWPLHSPVEGHGRADIGKCLVGVLSPKPDPKELAQRAELVIGRWSESLVFMKQPQRPLMRAQHARMGGKKSIDASKPSGQKRSIESGIMGDKLGDSVGPVHGGYQIDRCVSSEKGGEQFSSLVLRNALAFPLFLSVEGFAPAGGMNSVQVEMNLDLDGFEFAQLGIDGDGRHLHDRSPWLGSAGFKVDENESFVW